MANKKTWAKLDCLQYGRKSDTDAAKSECQTEEENRGQTRLCKERGELDTCAKQCSKCSQGSNETICDTAVSQVPVPDNSTGKQGSN